MEGKNYMDHIYEDPPLSAITLHIHHPPLTGKGDDRGVVSEIAGVGIDVVGVGVRFLAFSFPTSVFARHGHQRHPTAFTVQSAERDDRNESSGCTTTNTITTTTSVTTTTITTPTVGGVVCGGGLWGSVGVERVYGGGLSCGGGLWGSVGVVCPPDVRTDAKETPVGRCFLVKEWRKK